MIIHLLVYAWQNWFFSWHIIWILIVRVNCFFFIWFFSSDIIYITCFRIKVFIMAYTCTAHDLYCLFVELDKGNILQEKNVIDHVAKEMKLETLPDYIKTSLRNQLQAFRNAQTKFKKQGLQVYNWQGTLLDCYRVRSTIWR